MIPQHEFFGRKQEIANLSRILRLDTFQLIKITGRRRIGKTEFVKFVRNQLQLNSDIIFHTPIESDIATNIEKLYLDLEETGKELPQIPGKKSIILTYYPIFQQIEQFFSGIVIDEYPRLHRAGQLAYPKLPKDKNPIDEIIKDYKENKLTNPSFKIILMGSEVSLMEDLDEGNRPLRGLFDSIIKLKPFKFYELQYFYPNKTFAELLDIFGYSDGIPLYLWKFKDSKLDNFWDWLSESIIKDHSFWFSEINSIIEADFSIHGTRYGAILDAIAKGKTRPYEILAELNLEKTGDITPYLQKLLRTNIIVEEFPINDLYRPPHTSKPRKLKNGIYRLSDNFITFWFRFIKTTEALDPARITKFIQEGYSDYLGKVFERACREIIAKSTDYPYIGRWWGKIDQVMEECDILAFDPPKNEALLGICKWTRKPQNPNTLMKQAIRYEDHILYNRKARDMTYKYLIFSKNLEFEIDRFDGREVECYDVETLHTLMKTLI